MPRLIQCYECGRALDGATTATLAVGFGELLICADCADEQRDEVRAYARKNVEGVMARMMFNGAPFSSDELSYVEGAVDLMLDAGVGVGIDFEHLHGLFTDVGAEATLLELYRVVGCSA